MLPLRIPELNTLNQTGNGLFSSWTLFNASYISARLICPDVYARDKVFTAVVLVRLYVLSPTLLKSVPIVSKRINIPVIVTWV